MKISVHQIQMVYQVVSQFSVITNDILHFFYVIDLKVKTNQPFNILFLKLVLSFWRWNSEKQTAILNLWEIEFSIICGIIYQVFVGLFKLFDCPTTNFRPLHKSRLFHPMPINLLLIFDRRLQGTITSLDS